VTDAAPPSAITDNDIVKHTIMFLQDNGADAGGNKLGDWVTQRQMREAGGDAAGVQPIRKAFGHQDGGEEIFDESFERSGCVCRDGSEQTERCRCAHATAASAATPPAKLAAPTPETQLSAFPPPPRYSNHPLPYPPPRRAWKPTISSCTLIPPRTSSRTWMNSRWQRQTFPLFVMRVFSRLSL